MTELPKEILEFCGDIFRDDLEIFLGVFSPKMKFTPPFNLNHMDSCLLSNIIIRGIREIYSLKLT